MQKLTMPDLTTGICIYFTCALALAFVFVPGPPRHQSVLLGEKLELNVEVLRQADRQRKRISSRSLKSSSSFVFTDRKKCPRFDCQHPIDWNAVPQALDEEMALKTLVFYGISSRYKGLLLKVLKIKFLLTSKVWLPENLK